MFQVHLLSLKFQCSARRILKDKVYFSKNKKRNKERNNRIREIS